MSVTHERRRVTSDSSRGSLGTTPRTNVRYEDSLYLLRVHSSVVVDDVPVSIALKYRLEFSVDDDVYRLIEWLIKMHLDSKVTWVAPVRAAIF